MNPHGLAHEILFRGLAHEIFFRGLAREIFFRGLAHEGSWASWQHMECLYVQTSGGGGKWGLSLS